MSKTFASLRLNRYSKLSQVMHGMLVQQVHIFFVIKIAEEWIAGNLLMVLFKNSKEEP